MSAMIGAAGDIADGSGHDPAGADAALFDGLLEHVETHLGSTYAFDPSEGRGFGITMHRLEDALVSAVTTGLRFQDLAVRPPIEFVCSLQQDQEREAHDLAELAAGWVLAEQDASLNFGEWIHSDRPLVPGTAHHGLLFDVHPVWADDFSLYRGMATGDGGGEPVVRLISLIPLTLAEIELLESCDRERLWERWRDEKVPIWDIHRTG
jgi:hypothetical protein